jgi:serine/threonine-protein kinase RsbW
VDSLSEYLNVNVENNMQQTTGPLPASTTAWPAAFSHIVEACKRAQFDTKMQHRVELVCEEVFTNIIDHGFSGTTGDAAWLCMDTHANDGQLQVTFTDSAPAFDPLAARPKTAEDLPLEDMKIGGLGLVLLVSMTTERRYKRCNNCNVLTFWFQGDTQVNSTQT